jgi:hypothetical protein
LKALAHNLRRSQMLFAGFCPSHRYGRDGEPSDGWAKLLSDREWDILTEWVSNVSPIEVRRTRENRAGSCPLERYKAFNFNSLLTYGTVEVRLLGHTLNTVKRKRMPRGDILTWLTQFGLEEEHAMHFRCVVESRGNEQFLLAA